jgi:hypothetical protein
LTAGHWRGIVQKQWRWQIFLNSKKLLPRQKLKLAEELWFEGVGEEALPVPGWHKKLLSERLAAYKTGKLKTVSVAELKRRLGVK